jgi:hypothetical protein
MLRILGFEKQAIGVLLTVESDEFMPDDPSADIRYILAFGILETYLSNYGFPAGASLTALLLDAFYDDVDMPHWEGDYEEEFQRIVAMGPERIEWHCDRDELLSAVTIDEDDPESVSGTWIAIRDVNAMRAASFAKLQEERLADEFISVMPVDQRTAPRDPSPASTPQTVESGITFVE